MGWETKEARAGHRRADIPTASVDAGKGHTVKTTAFRSKTALALLLLVLAVGVGACGGDEEATDEAAATTTSGGGAGTETTEEKKIGEGLTIGFVSITNCGNPTICALSNAFEAEAEALGARAIVLEWSGAGSPVDAAISNMDQLIAQKVDAIAFWPLDPGSMKAPTQRANDAGIPVFAHDLYDTADTGVITSVTQGRELKAKQAAELLCEQKPDGGDVLYGNYALPAPTFNFLIAKFKQYLQECSSGKLKVAQEFLNKTDDVAGSRTTAEPALQSHPNVVGVDAYNDVTAIGASQAAESLGKRDQIWISGYNVAPDGISALKAGRIDVSWDYQALVIGQILARTMIEYAAGENTSPPKVIMVWPKCYSVNTIDELPTFEERLARIGNGEYLADDDPELIESGDDIPVPSDDLPTCPE